MVKKKSPAPRARTGHRGPDAFVDTTPDLASELKGSALWQRGERANLSGALTPDEKIRRILERSGLDESAKRAALRDAAKKLDVRITHREGKATMHGDFEMPPELLTGGPSPAMDFMEALQRGDPAAERILEDLDRQYQNQTNEEASLADEFVASTYKLAKRWHLTKHEQRRVEPLLNSYRTDLRKAHRFVLDDDFVRYATEISSTLPAEKLLSRLQYATLPYEITWIEFNLHEKVKVMRAIHGLKSMDMTEVAPRLGIIMHRLTDTEFLMELAVETITDEQMFIGTVVCYFISTRDDYEWKADDGRRFGCKPMLMDDQQLSDVARASMWGYATGGKSTVLEKASQLNMLRLPSYLQRHGCMGYGRMHYIAVELAKSKDSVMEMAKLVLHEVGEFSGMGRWVVTVLAMLNEVPIDAHRVEPKGHVRTGLTNRRPRMDYHKVVLRLPKTEPIRYIERHFRTASRRRAHEVRAHWRTYLDEIHCKPNEHDWQYDHDEGWRVCGKCTAFGRLIHEHIRGDASLGWVRHDYVIKPAKER